MPLEPGESGQHGFDSFSGAVIRPNVVINLDGQSTTRAERARKIETIVGATASACSDVWENCLRDKLQATFSAEACSVSIERLVDLMALSKEILISWARRPRAWQVVLADPIAEQIRYFPPMSE
jgi:hypothetical protein